MTGLGAVALTVIGLVLLSLGWAFFVHVESHVRAAFWFSLPMVGLYVAAGGSVVSWMHFAQVRRQARPPPAIVTWAYGVGALLAAIGIVLPSIGVLIVKSRFLFAEPSASFIVPWLVPILAAPLVQLIAVAVRGRASGPSSD